MQRHFQSMLRRVRNLALAWRALGLASLACTALLLTSHGVQAVPAGQPFAFGLWGDMPYAKADDGPKMATLVQDMNAANLEFSIFDGDIKDGSSLCTDEVYTQGISLFNAFAAPVVYVPGDNEWTDCHRTNNGGYDNLERLNHLRQVMFAQPESFGQTTMPLEHQGALGEAYVENTRWQYGDVVFVGLNIPGSNNNRVHDDEECTKKSDRTPAQCAADNAEYTERDAKNIEWMQQSFAVAKEKQAKGLMVVFQGDPGFDWPETEDTDERALPAFDGYTAFLEALMAETRNFSGQVVLVHGDTHFFKLDKPLVHQPELLENFTRLETFGSPNIHWVKVTVDPSRRDVFLFEPMIVPGN
ncbi:hypothetical protein [Nodosilinea nodulosa]|uniref:hypothetical protein n=1 Tax=Nodosilinea nodulosa TaxID=416001 RepID=UPI0002E6D74A|nr:hypothetical protein [Nodosilinea nodulosa]